MITQYPPEKTMVGQITYSLSFVHSISTFVQLSSVPTTIINCQRFNYSAVDFFMCPEEDYSTVVELLAIDVKFLWLELKKSQLRESLKEYQCTYMTKAREKPGDEAEVRGIYLHVKLDHVLQTVVHPWFPDNHKLPCLQLWNHVMFAPTSHPAWREEEAFFLKYSSHIWYPGSCVWPQEPGNKATSNPGARLWYEEPYCIYSAGMDRSEWIVTRAHLHV